jgi:O-antigen/teichoic acid export membrane protein
MMSLNALLYRRKPGFPPSIDTAKGAGSRASSRNLRAVVTGATGAVARVVQIGTSLITIPLVIRYLGNERFGLWMTISSVLAMASFADFGIGNGVLNTVAKAFGQDDVDGVRRAVSSGFAVLGAISIVLLSAVYATFPFIPWADVFRVTSLQARAEAGPALLVFATCFALNIPLDIVQRVQLGLQQGFRYSLWQVCGSALGLAGVLGGVWLHLGLPALVAALAGAPVLATAFNAIHFFGFARPDLRPGIGLVTRKVIAEIARLGGLFFVLQLAVALCFSSDNLVLTRILGPLAVAQYAVPCKLFSLVATATSFFLAPLWPAYAEALARGDHIWIRRTLSRSLLLATGVSVGLSAFLVVFGNRIITLWVGPGMRASPILLAGLGIWGVLMPVGSTVAVFLNGLAVVRFQVLTSILAAFINIATSIYLTRHIGISGVVYGSILSYSIIVLVPCYWYVRRYLKSGLQGVSGASGRIDFLKVTR